MPFLSQDQLLSYRRDGFLVVEDFATRAECDDLRARAEQLVGTVAVLDQPIAGGRGRVKIDDAFWTVEGADMPLGTRVRVVAVNGMTLKVQEA